MRQEQNMAKSTSRLVVAPRRKARAHLLWPAKVGSGYIASSWVMASDEIEPSTSSWHLVLVEVIREATRVHHLKAGQTPAGKVPPASEIEGDVEPRGMFRSAHVKIPPRKTRTLELLFVKRSAVVVRRRLLLCCCLFKLCACHTIPPLEK